MRLIPHSHEFWVAIDTFAGDCGMRRRNDFHVGDLWLMSVGRLFLREWERRDAIDPEFFEGKSTSGWRDGHVADSDVRLRTKWRDRSRLYVDHYKDALYLIQDWLYGVTDPRASDKETAWLKNLDERGRPRKLMKCGSMEQLENEAAKWHRRRAQQQEPTSDRELGIDDEHFVLQLGQGHTLVRLMSPRALDRESASMRHCIGWGAYDGKVRHVDEYRYFSIRSVEGTAAATIEAQRHQSSWVLTQFYGPHNTEPDVHLRDLLECAMPSLDLKYRDDVTDDIADHLPPMNLPRRPI